MRVVVKCIQLHPDCAPRTKGIAITLVAETPGDKEFIASISHVPVEETGGAEIDTVFIPDDYRELELNLTF